MKRKQTFLKMLLISLLMINYSHLKFIIYNIIIDSILELFDFNLFTLFMINFWQLQPKLESLFRHLGTGIRIYQSADLNVN